MMINSVTEQKSYAEKGISHYSFITFLIIYTAYNFYMYH